MLFGNKGESSRTLLDNKLYWHRRSLQSEQSLWNSKERGHHPTSHYKKQPNGSIGVIKGEENQVTSDLLAIKGTARGPARSEIIKIANELRWAG